MQWERGTRRRFCGSLAAAAAIPWLPAAGHAAPTLDLADPRDALTAMVKMRGSLVPEDVPHWYYGTIYGVLPGRAPTPLVDFEGSEIDWYERQPDGTYRAWAATVSFFRDIRTRAWLETFDNPITGDRNVVRPNSISVKAHYVYSALGYKRSDDPRPLPADGRITDLLNWQELGDDIWLTMRRAYPPGSAMGEHQLLRGSRTELFDPDTTRVRTTAAPTYIAPWPAWMNMADHPGHTVWAGPAKKLDRVEDYPPALLERMERQFPEKLTAKPG